ncbi:MAG: hypothetical protein AB1757_13845 [Acidobacteriota bacterium]
MKGRIFLFQWDEVSAAKRAEALRTNGWQVDYEAEDGARGGKKVLENPPDIVLLDLARRASHSRATAGGLRGYKAGRYLNLLFIDGKPEDLEKTRAKVTAAQFTTSLELLKTLDQFANIGLRQTS